MKFLLLIAPVFLLLMATELLQAQSRTAKFEGKAEVVDDHELRILSWNIQMLPRMLFRISRGPIRRSKLIPRHIIDDQIDIIVFQEAFDPRARRLLRKRLEDTYPYMVGPANPAGFRLKTNSGIWILSKIPLTHLEEIDYKDCEGDDCLARKGALLVEAEWNGKKIQVLGTHLNAGGPEWIRENQYKEIRELVEKHKKEDVPQFLCGDFNTSKWNGSLYSKMVSTLGVDDGPLLSALQFTDDPMLNDMNFSPGKTEADRDVIDYIFLRPNGFQPASIGRYVRQYQQQWDKKHKDLSDHNGILMKIVFR